MINYDLHPLCTLFPRMVSTEFQALVADIKAHGLREPIVLHDGLILDGGNRYRACIQAGIEPHFSTFCNGNPVSFVLSANLHRRHMTAGQQAAIVASAHDWAKAQPAYRPEKGCNVAPLSTVAERSAQSGASERTQKSADKVAKADPDLAVQVAHGDISLPQAVAIVENKPPKPPKPKLLNEEESARILAENAELREQNAEIIADAKEAIDDNTRLSAIFESDDKLAEAMQEIERLRAEVRVVRERLNGKMNECVELNRLLKSCKAAREKLEKAAGK